jgi:hypothetical protein
MNGQIGHHNELGSEYQPVKFELVVTFSWIKGSIQKVVIELDLSKS